MGYELTAIHYLGAAFVDWDLELLEYPPLCGIVQATPQRKIPNAGRECEPFSFRLRLEETTHSGKGPSPLDKHLGCPTLFFGPKFLASGIEPKPHASTCLRHVQMEVVYQYRNGSGIEKDKW